MPDAPPRCRIIAEAGSNHDGRLADALALIDVAADAGADVVKFQLFTAAGLYPPNCGVVDTPAGPLDLYAALRDMELPHAWLPRLGERAAVRGIELLLSVFDEDGVDVVLDLGARAVKIASPELTHLPLLRRVGAAGVDVVLSTGLNGLGAIEEGLAALGGERDRVTLLHCVSAYPAPERDCNLDVLPVLAGAFGVPVGFSDHTLDPVAAPLVTAALGGAAVEKHITLDRRRSGPDHPFAIEPDELVAMVQAVRALERLPVADRLAAAAGRLGAERVRALRGRPDKRVAPSEEEMAACDRRALHARRDIAAGEPLDERNVAVLRGERNLRPGLHPRHWATLAGARATRDVPAGWGIEWDDVVPASRVVAVVQARLGSQRLPRKVLADLGGRTVLDRLLDALDGAAGLDEVVLAVPEGDRELVALARARGIAAVEGPGDDVLGRYALACRVAGADAIVRVTADCPLLDPELVGRAVAAWRARPCDHLEPEGYPRGTGDVEVVRAEALRAAAAEATAPWDREHVTPYLLARPERFACRTLPAPAGLRRPELRVCVDEPADLRAVRALWRALGAGARSRPPGVAEVVAALDASPAIRRANAGVRQRLVPAGA